MNYELLLQENRNLKQELINLNDNYDFLVKDHDRLYEVTVILNDRIINLNNEIIRKNLIINNIRNQLNIENNFNNLKI